MKIYKIVNKEGLFSNGKSEPQFTKKGKTWKEIGHLKNHFHNDEYKALNFMYNEFKNILKKGKNDGL